MSSWNNKLRNSIKTVNCPFCLKKAFVKSIFSDKKFDFFFCYKCFMGFIHPYPKKKELERYYHENYWVTPGLLGFIRRSIFDFFQARRKRWVLEYLSKGRILDVGAGEGKFAKSLNNQIEVTSLDVPSSKIINDNVLKVDFLKWQTIKKFDAVVFWESLEHTSRPKQYLKKAFKLLKKNGLVFIEYPRFDSIEANLFKQNWFHLDPPRHHSYITKAGLEKLATDANLVVLYHQSVAAYEYAIWGFIGSSLSLINLNITDVLKQNKSILLLLFLSPFFILVVIIEIIFVIFNQSPIGLMIARKS